MTLSQEEIARYARHIVLREIGGPGQLQLQSARILCIGAGGLGSPCLMYLAAAGAGTLGIVDDDHVALSNLQRQIIHTTPSVGQPKTVSAASTLAAINPHVRVVAHPVRLDADNAAEIIQDYDLVLDGSDNFDTRYLVNATCMALGKPLIAAAISQWEGQIGLYDAARGGPCYACVFPVRPAAGLAPTCAEVGVMGALAGVVGAMMAVEAIKHVCGAGQTLSGSLLLYDALWGESRKMSVARDPDCPVCRSAQRSARPTEPQA